jgi:hypothetical protein
MNRLVRRVALFGATAGAALAVLPVVHAGAVGSCGSYGEIDRFTVGPTVIVTVLQQSCGDSTNYKIGVQNKLTDGKTDVAVGLKVRHLPADVPCTSGAFDGIVQLYANHPAVPQGQTLYSSPIPTTGRDGWWMQVDGKVVYPSHTYTGATPICGHVV